MPYTIPDPQAFYAAIVTRVATVTGKPVGLAVAPANNVYPYAVVYPLSDESSEGVLSDPTQIVVWAFQVTCVSNGATGAHWMQRETREALHGHIPVVAGVGTTPIELADGSGITREDGPEATLFYSTDRFTAYTSI